MVWGAITYDTSSPLTLKTQRYFRASLSHICYHSWQCFQQAFFNKIILDHKQQGYHRNTSGLLAPYTGLSLSLYLTQLEHVWDQLGRQVGEPMCLAELESWLEELWNEMTQDTIRNLHASIPIRFVCCIKARRVPTRHWIAIHFVFFLM